GCTTSGTSRASRTRRAAGRRRPTSPTGRSTSHAIGTSSTTWCDRSDPLLGPLAGGSAAAPVGLRLLQRLTDLGEAPVATPPGPVTAVQEPPHRAVQEPRAVPGAGPVQHGLRHGLRVVVDVFL